MDCPQIDLYEFLTEAELQHYYNAVKDELKITNASQFKYATDEDLKSIGMSRPEIRRLRKFYEKYFPHGYLSKIKRLLHAPTSMVKKDEMTGSVTSTTAASPSGSLSGTATGLASKTSSSPSKAPNNKHIIPADAISVNKQLGTGEFGIVQQGVWTNGSERIQVAIKCLCRERMQSNPMEFLKEAAIMHSIEHENIVRLYGVVLATDSLMLVTELAHLRSLLECLKDPGLRVSFLTVPTLCEFGLQICNGMRYLENKRLIHRDLAARNILVFSKNKVKISDFGLSRALGVGKDYYKTNFNVNLKLPIAWCAPECINYLRFTNASDVWAFGVCLWEMFSYGFQPWAALTGLQILEAIDAPNYQRLEQPECCPREYYTLMMKCWQDDPSKRPKFSEIYEMLPDMKPEQLKAVANCLEAKTKEHLVYRQNDIITVLDRNTGTPYWKGVLNTGKTGFFNPSNTVAYVEGLPTLNRDSFSRNANERCSKRKLRTEMISKPQNDFKHTGHVGIDGASFGDIAFLGTTQNYNHVPRQIVTPYKPSEDIEQTPLLLPPTPTSPDSLQTASGYFADDSGHNNSTMNPSFVPSTENTPKHFANNGQTGTTFEFPTHNTNPFTHKTIDDSTMALQNNNYGIDRGKDNLLWRHSSITNGSGATGGSGVTFEEPHEYHEISDDDEITPDKLDFGPSLLDEINSMFGSMSATASSSKNSESESHNATAKRSDFSDLTSKLIRKNSAGGNSSKKSKNSCGTVKQISVKDEKILNHAIEIANEISARSMCDLVSDPTPSTQSPKRKFSFRFPHLSGHGSSDKSHGSGLSAAGGTGGSTTHMNSLSPHSKKKNFTEELKSIPDLQCFRSISSDMNTLATSSCDIRIPLFDKESSDFCFEKSREILTRPLQFGSRSSFTAPTPPPSLEYTDAISQSPRKDKKTLSENLMDIENTLKALNLDFMHTYTDVDKNDSDETILNDQFSSIVSSLDDEISSATGSLKSSTVYNYQNGKHTTTTTFDFNAATNHLDKHLQLMSGQVNKNSPNSVDKRSSTPDTGFASRDTISLSRRSSQKSSYSPQDSYFSPKDLNFPSSSLGGSAGCYANFKTDIFKYGDDMVSPFRSITTVHKTSNTSIYSPNQLRIDEANNDTYNGNQEQRQRSMSFTDNLNRDSAITEKRNGKLLQKPKQSEEVSQKTKAMSYKSRSARARTLRRLSYNPMPQVATSSSSTDDDSDHSMDRSMARSECDIRSRGSGSLYQRRRRAGFNRKLFAVSVKDDHDVEIQGERQSKIYGSNASIKSAPHYNYTRSSRSSAMAASSSQRPYKLNPYEETYPYEERIYDFGAAPPKTKPYNAQLIPKPPKTFQVSSIATNSGSGSSSASSAAASFTRSVVAKSSVFQEFDVTRLTGRSPTSNVADAEHNNTASHLEFQWPEKIHASTVKQNEMLWRQQQQQIPEFNAHGNYRSSKDQPSSTLSSSTTDSDQFEYRMGYTTHLPPSPAP
ncbi:Tyrosine-protein kinase PR2 [Lucilia cuprina]|nr:Tyrosine-protein kinase PR2 [Lucilia cuprina]